MIHTLSREENLTILFSSHNLDQVQKVCDRVALFDRGKLLSLIDIGELRRCDRDLADTYNRLMTKGGAENA